MAAPTTSTAILIAAPTRVPITTFAFAVTLEASDVNRTWAAFLSRPSATQRTQLIELYTNLFRDAFQAMTPEAWSDALKSAWGLDDSIYLDANTCILKEQLYAQLATALVDTWTARAPATSGVVVARPSVPNMPFSPLTLEPTSPLAFRVIVQLSGETSTRFFHLVLPQAPVASKGAHRSSVNYDAIEADVRQRFQGQEVPLTQTSFDDGTLYITQPGVYVLQENVSFNPEEFRWASHTDQRPSSLGPAGASARSSDPRIAMGQALGAFAAIAVCCEDVVIDLNGKRLEQSVEHALQQRFFAIIELASAAFMPLQGPFDASATSNFSAANRVVVCNGTLGRSSHHGIHANVPSYVYIHDLVAENYEVAAVAINGGKHVCIKDCNFLGQRGTLAGDRVPVSAAYSNARFLLEYVRAIETEAARAAYEALAKCIDIAFFGLVPTADMPTAAAWFAWDYSGADVTLPTGLVVTEAEVRMAARLFDNPSGVIDGSAYGILSNNRGVAVGGFPDTLPVDAAYDVLIENVVVQGVVGNVHETPALRHEGKACIDPIGAVLQTRMVARDGTKLACDWEVGAPKVLTRFIGNPLLNAQILVFEHKSSFGPRGRRAWLDPAFVAWTKLAPGTSTYTAHYFVNCDVMMHTMKGCIGLKLDATMGVAVRNVVVRRVENVGRLGSDVEGDYTNPSVANAAGATLVEEGYQGGDSRGVSVASSVDVYLSGVEVRDVKSACADSIGYDLLKGSRGVVAENCVVSGSLDAGLGLVLSEYVCTWDRGVNGSTTVPRSLGVHADRSVLLSRVVGFESVAVYRGLGQKGAFALEGTGVLVE